VDPHAQVFGNKRATSGAQLRCASGVHAQHDTPGTLSLVRGVLHELAPGHIGNIPVDDSFPLRLHGLNIQVFKDDHLIGIYQLARGLMGEVGSPIGRPFVGVMERLNDFAPRGTAWGIPFFLALQASDVIRVLFHPPLAMNRTAV